MPNVSIYPKARYELQSDLSVEEAHAALNNNLGNDTRKSFIGTFENGIYRIKRTDNVPGKMSLVADVEVYRGNLIKSSVIEVTIYLDPKMNLAMILAFLAGLGISIYLVGIEKQPTSQTLLPAMAMFVFVYLYTLYSVIEMRYSFLNLLKRTFKIAE